MSGRLLVLFIIIEPTLCFYGIGEFVNLVIDDPRTVQCSHILIDTDGKNKDILLEVSKVLHFNSKATTTIPGNRDLFQFERVIRFKRCVDQIIIGGIEETKAYIRKVWNEQIIGPSYFYVFIIESGLENELINFPETADIVNFVVLPIPPKVVITETNFPILTLFPFGSNRGGNLVKTLNVWQMNKGLMDKSNSSELFPDKFKNLNDKVMRVTYMEASPFFDKFVYEDGSFEYSGLDYEILKAISETMNYKNKFTKSIDGQWGSIKPDGSWGGMTGMAFRNETDIGGTAFTISYSRETVSDFSIGYYQDASSVLAKKPPPLPKWQALYWPFETLIWIFLATTLVCFLIVYNLLFFISKVENTDSVSKSSLKIWASFLNQGIVHPKGSAARILMASWFLFSFSIIASYAGSLMSFLTLPGVTKKPIESLTDLAKSDLNVVIVNGSIQNIFLETSEDTVYKKIWNKVLNPKGIKHEDILVNDFQYALDSPMVVPKVGVIIDRSLLAFNLVTKFPDQVQNFHLGKERIFPSQYGFAFRRNAPFLHKFNEKLIQILRSGLVEYWEKSAIQLYIQYKKRIKEKSEIKEEESEGTNTSTGLQALSIDHMQGPFLILSLGIFLTIIVFFVEVFLGRKKL